MAHHSTPSMAAQTVPASSRRIRRWATIGFTVLLILSAALALVWLFAWRSPPFFTAYQPRPLRVPVMTMQAYEALPEHDEPYIVAEEGAGGALLLYGAAHTKDPDNPQLADIRTRWSAFAPTVALVEGRLGFLIPGLMDAVGTYGEGGEVKRLADASGVRLYSWEPPRELEVQGMLEQFPAERVALFYVLRPYFSDLRHGKPDNPEAVIEELIQSRTRYAGIERVLAGVDDIDRIWRRDFAGLPDWRDTSDEHGMPGYLAELAAHSNQIRDEHLAQVILTLVEQGERVFVVAGSSHSVKLEATLRDALGATHPGSRQAG